MNLSQFLPKSLSFKLAGLSFAPTYIQAAAVIALLFLLVLVMAQMRRHFIDWSIKGAFFGLFFGFLLALILEGFLIIGGKTAITEIIGWKNAPKPLLTVLDMGRSKLTDVLGINTQIPPSNAQVKSTSDEVVQSFQSLTPGESQKVRKIICAP